MKKKVGYREIGTYLVVDPQMCFGKLTFKGTRIPVSTVLTYIAKGETLEEILYDWPGLQREALEEAIRLAAMALVDITGARPTNGQRDPARPWGKPLRKQKRARASTR